MNELQEAVGRYIDTFDEGPPIFGMEEDEALSLINQAIEDGDPIEEGAEEDLPPGAYL